MSRLPMAPIRSQSRVTAIDHFEKEANVSNSAVLRGYLDLLGVVDRSAEPSDVELRRRSERLERKVRDLERENRRLHEKLEARTAERTRAEPARTASDLDGLRRMAGGLSHRFNNLMTAIGCSSDFLRSALPEESEDHQHLDVIDQAWKRGSELCRRLRIASDDMPFHDAELDLNEVVRQTEPVVSTLAKSVRLRLRLEGSRLPLTGDATLIRQLILELTANAREAIGDGPGQVTISTRSKRTGPDRLRFGLWERQRSEASVVLEVSDDGCGMEPDLVGQIFDPFFTTRFLGRGLGLTAVFSIVEKHGGKIRVSSQPGRGTTFQVLLPARGATRVDDP